MFDLAHLAAWGGFLVLICLLLAIDLFVLHRKPRQIQMREALIGASVPVLFALLFAGAVYYLYETHTFGLGIDPAGITAKAAAFWPDNGNDAVLMYLTGYVIEISLSADNVFLFVVLMTFFVVPGVYQHRVLFWGVLGALVMRAGMIIAGYELLQRFEWVILVFGFFLLFTGVKMLLAGEQKKDPGKSVSIRLMRKMLPVTSEYHGKSFFVRLATPAGMKTFATPLFLVLVAIEITDVIFAVDSIPAIFAVSQDPFIVFTSNVFAILGLRSMYFLLAGVIDKFHYLRVGLAVVLTFVGVKMLLPWAGDWVSYWRGLEGAAAHHWQVPTPVSLMVIVVVLLGSVVASLAFGQRGGGTGTTKTPRH